MNARMKELVAKADEYADSLGLGGAEWCDAQLEKLTELIVQECLMKAIGAKIRGESIDTLIQNITEDFGVK